MHPNRSSKGVVKVVSLRRSASLQTLKQPHRSNHTNLFPTVKLPTLRFKQIMLNQQRRNVMRVKHYNNKNSPREVKSITLMHTHKKEAPREISCPISEQKAAPTSRTARLGGPRWSRLPHQLLVPLWCCSLSDRMRLAPCDRSGAALGGSWPSGCCRECPLLHAERSTDRNRGYSK